jgi:hypothetical protein
MRTISGGCELAAGSKAVRHESFEEDWVQVCTREIDGGSVACWARADDDL